MRGRGSQRERGGESGDTPETSLPVRVRRRIIREIIGLLSPVVWKLSLDDIYVVEKTFY